MTQSTLKKRIHQALDNTKDDEVLKTVYSILKSNISTQEVSSLTLSQKKELDKRLADHKNGKLKYYSFNQVKKEVLKSLKNKR